MENINPTGMWGEVVLVTPELAAKWLAKMVKQRKIRPNRLSCYVNSRKNGEWALTHQGIAFDTDDVLIDGQNRLTMVIKTGMPTPMFVVRNVPKIGCRHIDENLPRTAVDALRMSGDGDFSTSELSVVRVILSYPSSEPGSSMFSKEEYLRRISKWSEHLAFANQHKGQSITRAVRALAARADAAGVDRDRLTLWCEILVSGMPIDPAHDSAAISYRNYLISQNKNGQFIEVEKYCKGQAALSYFLDRKPMSKVYGTDKDLFPVPAGME